MQTFQKLLTLIAPALVLVLALALPATAAADKVTICHAAGLDGTTKYVRIVVARQATSGHFDNNGTPLAGHEDDLLLEGDVECPGGSVEPTPTPSQSVTPTPSQSPTASTAPTPSPSGEPVASPTLTPGTTPDIEPVGSPVTELPDTAMER